MIRLAIIGDPVEHSFSPKVHGASLSAMGIEYEYEKVRVQKGGLEEYIKRAIETKTDGFNITMPHKTDIIPYLEDMDDEARLFSSVNTVCIRDGKLYGYNTDAIGYELSIKDCGSGFNGNRVVILGAGGVVRTLALKAAMSGAERIHILNRSIDKALGIREMVQSRFDIEVVCGGFSNDELSEACKNADLLINATPLGMSGCPQYENLDFLESLPSHAFVSDLIYNPDTTEFLKKADELGHKTLNGTGMLIYQALAAEEHYLNQKIDMKKLYKEIKAQI